jgi:two-component system, NarL family, invasion response regulator UvrY
MKILLVDAHPIVREGFRRIFAEVFADLECGEAETGAEALRLVRASTWDLVVLELSLPGRTGLELLEEIHRLRPRLPILVLTLYAEDQYATRSFRAGASGYVAKSRAPGDLVAAVHKLLQGGRYVSPELAEHLAASLVSDSGRPLHESLSDRELQVLRLLASGLTVKEIAQQLALSEKTVSTYRSRILDKMNMRTAAQLMRYAIRSDLVD